MSLFQIECGVQSYDWGKIGASSAVAKFKKDSDSSFDLDEKKPYSELWMGTHPSVPSKIKKNQTSLSDLIKSNPEKYLSANIEKKFNSKSSIPFLFKVLSIRKALSIQAHPDKKLAERLHSLDPAHYPDDNHKPEMAIALTPFEGFCGFKPLKEIASFLNSVPQLKSLVGEKSAQEFIKTISENNNPSDQKLALKSLFNSLMKNTHQDCSTLLSSTAQSLVDDAKKNPSTFANGNHENLANLIVRLNKDFPNDIGLFCGPLFLNYVHLTSGQAIFLRANDPHAYLSGDIIECMAASDNVVRAGFTPKFKDVTNLVSMLTYNSAPIQSQIMTTTNYASDSSKANGDGTATLYDPPIEEFSVLKVELSSSNASEFINSINGPSIVIVTSGEGTISSTHDNNKEKTPIESLSAHTGFVFFVPPNTPIVLKSSSSTPFITYRAFCQA